MPDRITLQVTRYRPENESEPTTQSYEVPCPKDWVVLDGLNHIKDQIDGTLSFRWSCRMGICGSCGMLVNGEPKLTCVKPWIVRQVEQPLSAGEYRQTPEEMDEYKQFSMCINCMLCYSACPIYGLDPKFIGPAAIALAQRYNLDTRDEGASDRMEVLSEHEGIWGCTFVGECTKVCPKHVDPAGAIQRYKLSAAVDEIKSFFMPRGA